MRFVLVLLLLAACSREPLAPEKFGAIRSALPAFKERTAQGGPGHGTLERRDGKGAVVTLSWDADERIGPPSEAAAVVAANAPAGTTAAPAEPVATHPTLEVAGGGARMLVWRCDKSRRLLRLSMSDAAASKADLRDLATGIGCHAIGDKPVNGEVPVADTALLGSGWSFARRQPASASWLHADGVLTLFAGQRAPGVRDPETAARIAPEWVQAAGLLSARVASTQWVAGPSKHQALRVTGSALLDRRPVRFTLFLWRCMQRGRSHAALVFTQGGGASASDWTGRDAALLAARCHG